MELVEKLMNFGLTRQEAVIYLTMQTDGALTGYEVAKLTGISRSNVYTALAGLVEKGVAYVQEENVTKYTPVKFEEFSSNFIHRLEGVRKEILEEMPSRREESEGYITIRGKKNILDKLRNMLLETQDRVYMSVNNELFMMFKEELTELITRGAKVVLLADKSIELEGAVFYHKEDVGNEIRVICDSHKVLTGNVDKTSECTCLYSQNQNLVEIFKRMLKNEITLIELKE